MSAHATRTIFGMPALDVAGLKAAEAAAAITRQATSPAAGPGAAPAAPAASVAPAPAAPAAPPAAVAASAPAAPVNDRHSATKTIFGVPAPRLPEKGSEKGADKPAEKAHEEPAKPARPAGAPQSAAEQRAERKTGARKTVVPAPAIIPPSGTGEPAPAAPLAAASAGDTSRTTHQGYGGPSSSPAEVVPVKAPVMEERTAPVRAASAKKSRGIPVWTYVGVGFLFGLALLGIYQLVGVLAH
jgi:hypothetical protein